MLKQFLKENACDLLADLFLAALFIFIFVISINSPSENDIKQTITICAGMGALCFIFVPVISFIIDIRNK